MHVAVTLSLSCLNPPACHTQAHGVPPHLAIDRPQAHMYLPYLQVLDRLALVILVLLHTKPKLVTILILLVRAGAHSGCNVALQAVRIMWEQLLQRVWCSPAGTRNVWGKGC